MATIQIKSADEFPPEKLLAIKLYAAQIRKKYPKFKEQRVARKVAEHFKITLTDDKTKFKPPAGSVSPA